MRVECVKLLNWAGKEVDTSPWLSLSVVYLVLGMYVDADRNCKYRIVTFQDTDLIASLALIRSDCFKIVSTIVPSNWKVEILKSGYVGIEPAAWQEAGFMERLYDRDDAAYEIFLRERAIIMAEDPNP